MYERTSFVAAASSAPDAGKRNVKKVPFVELFGGRLQGVVSSGSDIQRVYVSFIAANTGNFYCSTNNNRPCGGLGGSPCKHIDSMLQEAMLQFGEEAVLGYLGVAAGQTRAHGVASTLGGTQQKEQASRVFSRFLSYLRYCELSARPGLVSEASWFG
ncbi:MAG: hypothetical protein AB7K71_28255 [Polyangiaceae bacterium]